jgi:hypothetical protein
VAAPACVGVKVTVNWQELAAATEPPHELLAIEKGPVMALVNEIAVVPLLLAVT